MIRGIDASITFSITDASDGHPHHFKLTASSQGIARVFDNLVDPVWQAKRDLKRGRRRARMARKRTRGWS